MLINPMSSNRALPQLSSSSTQVLNTPRQWPVPHPIQLLLLRSTVPKPSPTAHHDPEVVHLIVVALVVGVAFTVGVEASVSFHLQ